MATAFVAYGEALRVLESLRGNGLLHAVESDEALAEQYAFMYAGAGCRRGAGPGQVSPCRGGRPTEKAAPPSVTRPLT